MRAVAGCTAHGTAVAGLAARSTSGAPCFCRRRGPTSRRARGRVIETRASAGCTRLAARRAIRSAARTEVANDWFFGLPGRRFTQKTDCGADGHHHDAHAAGDWSTPDDPERHYRFESWVGDGSLTPRTETLPGMEVGEGSPGPATTGDGHRRPPSLEAADAQIDRSPADVRADADATRVYVAGDDTDGGRHLRPRPQDHVDHPPARPGRRHLHHRTAERQPYHAIIRRGVVGDIAVTGVSDAAQGRICRRLVAYRYRQKGRAGMPMRRAHLVTIRHEMPRDVRDILDPYVRRV